MFNPTQVVIDSFVNELHEMYKQTYGILEPSYPGIMSFVARLALENIATSDAAYHDVNHTIMVTLVGQEILRGKHISVGGVTPREWLHFIVSLLCHDIGYVRGVCRQDDGGRYATGRDSPPADRSNCIVPHAKRSMSDVCCARICSQSGLVSAGRAP